MTREMLQDAAGWRNVALAAVAVAGFFAGFATGPKDARIHPLPPEGLVSYWLVETVPGVEPSALVIDDFDNARDCITESFRHVPQSPDGFATCIGLDEPAEEYLAAQIAADFGYARP